MAARIAAMSAFQMAGVHLQRSPDDYGRASFDVHAEPQRVTTPCEAVHGALIERQALLFAKARMRKRNEFHKSNTVVVLKKRPTRKGAGRDGPRNLGRA